MNNFHLEILDANIPSYTIIVQQDRDTISGTSNGDADPGMQTNITLVAIIIVIIAVIAIAILLQRRKNQTSTQPTPPLPITHCSRPSKIQILHNTPKILHTISNTQALE
jgi:hypothetical protein